MNKPSSHSEKPRVGVSPSVAPTPSNVFSGLRRIGAGVAMLTAAACGYNPGWRDAGVEADGGTGDQDAMAQDGGADVSPDVGMDAVAPDGEADAGADVAVDTGVDAGEDATDAGADVAPDADIPCVNGDSDLVCDDDDLCDLDPAVDDADNDGCDDLNGDDVCLGDDTNNADSDGDGMGDGFAIDPVTGEVIRCDYFPLCNPVAEGAEPGTPQELWCDPNSDADVDGIPDIEDCFPLDASKDCGDREASILLEWLKKQNRGGENLPEESRLA